MPPTIPWRSRGLIRSLVAAGRIQEAAERFYRFAEKSEMTLETKLLQCSLLVDMERYTDSLTLYDQLVTEFGSSADQIERQRDDRFAALDGSHRQAALDHAQSAAEAGVQQARAHHVMLLSLFGDYEKSVGAYTNYGLKSDDLTPNAACWLAWAFFKTGMPEDALTIYNSVLTQDPEPLLSRIGSTYCLAVSGKSLAALSVLETLDRKMPDNLEILYATAYAHEQIGHLREAIDVYDKMLALAPGNQTVESLRIRAFSDMGASTYARSLDGNDLPDDHALALEVTADSAADRIRWEEPASALRILDGVPHDAAGERFDYDRIVALNHDDRHLETVEKYESLSRQDGAILCLSAQCRCRRLPESGAARNRLEFI